MDYRFSVSFLPRTNIGHYSLYLTHRFQQLVSSILQQRLWLMFGIVRVTLNDSTHHFFCSLGDGIYGQSVFQKRPGCIFSSPGDVFQQHGVLQQIFCNHVGRCLLHHGIMIAKDVVHTRQDGTYVAAVFRDRLHQVSCYRIAWIDSTVFSRPCSKSRH